MAKQPEESAFQINASVDHSLASSLASTQHVLEQSANTEAYDQPKPVVVEPVTLSCDLNLMYNLRAEDKSDGGAAEPQRHKSVSKSVLNDSFARQMDPAELAFQRDQLKEIESQRIEQEWTDRIQCEAKLRIVKVENDGNCLYRAISFQAYGDVRHHKIVRQKCMDYVHLNGLYFLSFIDLERYEGISDYVTQNRRDKVWGDNLEIQAMAELYDMPVEIYEYRNEPDRTFNRQGGRLRCSQPNATLRLSYHRKNHYNAVVPNDWDCSQYPYFTTSPGAVEDQRIASLLATMDPGAVPTDFAQQNIERSRESMMFEADIEAAIAASRQGFERSMSVQEPRDQAHVPPPQQVGIPQQALRHQQQQAAVYVPVLVRQVRATPAPAQSNLQVDVMEQQRLIEAQIAVDNQRNAAQQAAAAEEEKKESKTRKLKNKFVKFFKGDVGSWITNAATAIAGPPAAFLGQASENINEVLDGGDSSSEEERQLEAAARQERRRREAAKNAQLQQRAQEAEQVQLAMAMSASEAAFQREQDHKHH